ncbi:MAG: hypothetical protein WD688_09460 [Candidatus Binatia bacterium]
MARCKAGECEVECGGGKGCGCIAESDNPFSCACFCFGETPGETPVNDLRIEPSTIVDVSISDLPLFEVANFFNRVHTGTIIAPADKLREQVSLNIQRQTFVDVLNQLGLTTGERIERDKRRLGLLMFLAGFAIGALIFGPAEKRSR